jgi:hypothetical protein
MLILFKLIFYSYFIKSCIFFHFINYLVVNRHRMKSYYQTYYFRFYSFYLFEKFQFTNFSYCYSLLRICHEHPLNNFNSINTDIAWQNIKSLNDFFVKFFRCFLFKRKRTTNHPIKNYSKRPNISYNSIIRLSCDHFRWSIAGTTTGSSQKFSILIIIR